MARDLTTHEQRARELRQRERGQTQTRRRGKGAATRRRRATTGAGWGYNLRTFLGYVTLLILSSVAVGLVWLAVLFYGVAKDLPAPDNLMDYAPGGVTEIYATDKDPKTGKNVVLGRVFSQMKKFVPIHKMPDHVKNATIAIEDERFFSHPGVDLRGMARAMYRNVREKRMGEGGSTLTQQLARNVYLTQKKTFNRKAQEIMLAIQLEKNYSKEQILEMYLNEVYYGSNAYGIAAAAEVYFGKKLNELSVSQAALLAGLPQRPNDLAPFANKKAAIARRNDVLGKMAQLGYITAEESRVCQSNGVRLIAEKPKNQFEFKAPYFTNYVVRQLVERYGTDTVYKGGIKVYTTLNWKMQQEAERALVNGVLGAASARVTEGALISLEPRTGYIRAMVGGVDFKKNEFNNVVQGRRQPGSAFKVFVYTAAFDTHRFSPYSYVYDGPVSFPSGTGKRWRPQNYGGGYHGSVSLRQALTHSYNIPAVKVADAIGPRKVIEYARKMGITSPLAPDLSIALGSHPVSPLEMAAAYSVFPNHGNRALPMSIIRVVDNEGVALESNAPQVEQVVIPETTVAQISEILGDVVSRGTAAGAKGIQEISNAHGKTGTTNDNRDAWFVGYTPELSTAVWVCGVKRTTKNGRLLSRYVPMGGVTGGRVCAPIWARFMKTAIPIQRKSGEPIPPAPEKVVPKKFTFDGAAADRKTAKPADGGAPTPRFQQASLETDTVSAAAPSTAVSSSGEIVPASPLPVASSPSAPKTATPSALPLSRPEPVLTAPSSSSDGATAAPVLRGLGITRAESGSSGIAAVQTRAATPVAPVEPRLVAVRICADSGQRATRWCPETVQRALRRAPRSCRRHRSEPGG